MPYTLLDGVPFYTKNEIDNEFSEGSVSEERARAQAAEQANATAIANEVERAVEADNSLQTQIQDVEGLAEQTSVELGAEANRAKAAEQVNATAIANEVSRATNAEQDNANTISAERNRALLAEGNLSTAIIEEASRATAAENTKVDKTNLPDKVYGTDAQGAPKLYTADDFADIIFIPITVTSFPTITLPEGLYWSDIYDYINNNKTVVLTLQYDYATHWFWPNKVGKDQIDYRVFFTCIFVGNNGALRLLYSITQSDTRTRTATLNRMDIGEPLYAGTGITLETIAGSKRITNSVSPLVPVEATAQNQLADKAYVDTAIAAAIDTATEIVYITGTITQGTTTGINLYIDGTAVHLTEIKNIINSGKLPIFIIDIVNSGVTMQCYFMPCTIGDGVICSNITLFRDRYNSNHYYFLRIIESYTYVIEQTFIDTYSTMKIDTDIGYGDVLNTSVAMKRSRTREDISVSIVSQILNGNGDIDGKHVDKLVYGFGGYMNNDSCLAFFRKDSNYLYEYMFMPRESIQSGFPDEKIFSNIVAAYRKSLSYPNSNTLELFAIKSFVEYKILSADTTINVIGDSVFIIKHDVAQTINITLDTSTSLNFNYGGKTTINNVSNVQVNINYVNKQGTQTVYVLEPGKIVSFIHMGYNGTGFICEHTVPLTDTNGSTYDVVVRE